MNDFVRKFLEYLKQEKGLFDQANQEDCSELDKPRRYSPKHNTQDMIKALKKIEEEMKKKGSKP